MARWLHGHSLNETAETAAQGGQDEGSEGGRGSCTVTGAKEVEQGEVEVEGKGENCYMGKMEEGVTRERREGY